MFGKILFDDIDIEQQLRSLADQIQENREYKTIINLYMNATKLKPIKCDKCEPGLERIKCENCKGYGYVFRRLDDESEQEASNSKER